MCLCIGIFVDISMYTSSPLVRTIIWASLTFQVENTIFPQGEMEHEPPKQMEKREKTSSTKHEPVAIWSEWMVKP